MGDIRIQPGVPDFLRPAAGQIYFEAFADKLRWVLGHDGRGAQLFARMLDLENAITALSADGKHLLGLAGLRTSKTAFMSGTLTDMAAYYGWFGGLWRGTLLQLLDHSAEPDCLHIESLTIAADARGNGVGTQLLNACASEARARGLSALSLDVIDTNPRARALYERFGFRERRSTSIWPFTRLFGFHKAARMVCELDPA